jgi:flagellar biosynthesis chaperone FliJ
MQQNQHFLDRGEDVEIVAQQLKQLEELVSELEEGLEDARRGEAEARAEVEFLRGEVERTKLELKKERDYSAAALKDAHSTSDSPRSSSELDQKDDEIRGLKAIIHSLSRGNPNAAGLGQNGLADDHNSELVELEQRIQEVEETVGRKDNRIEELERELQEMQLDSRGGRNRSATVTLSPKQQHRPSHSSGNISNTSNGLNQVHRLSDRTVVPNDWHDAPSEPRHHRGASNSSQQRLETMHESERGSDEDTMWCEICETGGHDILNCTSMFGSGQNNERAKKPVEAEEPAPEHPAEKTESSQTSNSDNYADATSQKTGRDVVLEGLKGIGGLGNSMDPVAGKSSGVIDESKWCALCERDGHESIDCPFDE